MWASRPAWLAVLLAGAVGAAAQPAMLPLDDSLAQARRLSADGDYGRALQTLHDAAPAAAVAADRARLSNAAGWTNFLAGDSAAAQQDLQRALAYTEPGADSATRRKVLNNLGVLHFSRGNTAQAEPYFAEAAALDSDTAQRFLAVIEAQKRAERVQQLIAAGAAQRREADFQGAITYYEQALEQEPGNVQALAFRGYAEFRAGALERARATLETAGRIDLNHGYVALNLMKVYCAQQDGAALAALLARDSEKTAPPVVAGYWQADGELRRVCRDQPLLVDTTAAIGGHELP